MPKKILKINKKVQDNDANDALSNQVFELLEKEQGQLKNIAVALNISLDHLIKIVYSNELLTKKLKSIQNTLPAVIEKKRRVLVKETGAPFIPDTKIKEALVVNEGMLVETAKLLDVPLSYLQKRIDNSPYLKEQLQVFIEELLDIGMQKLKEKVMKGDSKMLLFLFSCFGKQRGLIPIDTSKDQRVPQGIVINIVPAANNAEDKPLSIKVEPITMPEDAILIEDTNIPEEEKD